MNKLTRQEVFDLIDEEIDYAVAKHGDDNHTVRQWLDYIQDYLSQAAKDASRDTEDAQKLALHGLRKIATCSVLAQEQNGGLHRWKNKNKE